MTNEQMRADFEAWAVSQDYGITRDEDQYRANSTAYAWEGYQAATLAERERCALVCDELGEYWSAYKDTALLNGDVDLSNAASGEPRAAEAIAKAIRMPPTATPQGNL